MDKHALLVAVKDLAIELGRSPTRAEFTARVKGGHYQLSRFPSGFTGLLIAAGLETYDARRSGPDKKAKLRAEDVFGKCVEARLEEHKGTSQKALPVRKFVPPTAVVGDLHFPFVHKPTLERFYAFLKHMVSIGQGPKRVVQVGDLLDLFSFSAFPKSPNIYTPKQELDLGIQMAKDFWKTVQEIVPGVECFQILGNHDVRPMKRLMEKAPELEGLIDFAKFFQFEGVTTISDYRQELILNGIVFHHGYRSQLGQHRDHNLMNSVVGHTHQGGCVFRQIRDDVLWEMNAGYMGDPDAKALSYGSQKISKWTLGWGWIDGFGPRFIPA